MCLPHSYYKLLNPLLKQAVNNGGITKRSFSQATPEIEKIAEDFGLKLKTFHLAKTMPGYFQGMHHDQDGSLHRVGVLYLTEVGKLIFPGEKIEVDTTPGKLVIFRPDMIHYVPPQAEGRHFIRMDFSN